jgi:hypothetical protein
MTAGIVVWVVNPEDRTADVKVYYQLDTSFSYLPPIFSPDNTLVLTIGADIRVWGIPILSG